MTFRLTRWFQRPSATAALVIFNKALHRHTSVPLPRSGTAFLDLEDLRQKQSWISHSQTVIRLQTQDGTDSPSEELTRRIRLSELGAPVSPEQIIHHTSSDSLWSDTEQAVDQLGIWTYVLPDQVESALIRLHTDVVGGFGRGLRLTDRSPLVRVARRYIAEKRVVPGSLVSEILCDLYLWSLVEGARVTTGAKSDDDRSRAAWQSVKEFGRAHPSLACSRLWLAFDASRQGNRAEAAAQLAHAKTLDSCSLLERLASLRGLYTYSAEIPDQGSEPQVTVQPQISPLISHGPVRRARAIVYSGDVRFFRRYFPRIHYYARLMTATELHIHLIGEEPDVRAAVDDALQLADQMDRTMDDGRRASMSITYEKTPAGVSELKTYYACARFLRAAEFLHMYPEGVWIQDLDLVQTGAVEPLFAKFKKTDFGASLSPVGYGSIPWKSLLAGSVWVASSPAGRRMLTATSAYILHHLSAQSTWMLDQNALRFAMDVAGADVDFVNMNTVSAPVGQNSLSGLIEKG